MIPTLFAAIVFGPLAAMLVAAASMIGALLGLPLKREDAYLKWVNYTCDARAYRCDDWSHGGLGGGASRLLIPRR